MQDDLTLFVTTPNALTLRALQRAIRDGGLPFDEPEPLVLTVCLTQQILQELCTAWAALLKPAELHNTKCRIVHSNAAPTLAELMQTESLQNLINRLEGEWLREFLRTGDLVTYFQPIVRTDNPSDVFAYECLLRGVDNDGNLIPPSHLYAVARTRGLVRWLDERARLTAIESATKHQLSTNIFINFNPRSIDQSMKCLESTLREALGSGISPERFVFEVVESEEIADVDQLLRILDFCREAGCRVALDDLGAGHSSLNLMAQIKPDFVKIDMGLMRDVDCDLYKSCIAGKLLELARELQVHTIVEGVETVGQWQWASGHGADYAQGYLFAKPNANPSQSQFDGSITQADGVF